MKDRTREETRKEHERVEMKEEQRRVEREGWTRNE